MASNPSTRWYFNDWETEGGLMACSMAAQGLWMRMLCIMARATPCGYLRVGDKPLGIDELAHLVGQDKRHVRRWYRELERHAVFSPSDSGIFNRRLAREENKENRQKSARARADSDSDSLPPLPPLTRGGLNSKNGKDKEPSYGPLRDPTEIARDLGIRK